MNPVHRQWMIQKDEYKTTIRLDRKEIKPTLHKQKDTLPVNVSKGCLLVCLRCASLTD